MRNAYCCERMVEVVPALIVLGAFMTLSGKGFHTLWPVVAGTSYALIQPFFRFFLFDQVRTRFYERGDHALFILCSGLLHTALAVGVARFFA